MPNHCGQCDLCCRLLGVVALAKMPGDPCKFCTPGQGCQIHEQPTMPQDCREYVCLWRQCKDEGVPLPDTLRPDRCHVVIDVRNFEQTSRGQVHNVRCDPNHPEAWRQPDVQKLLGAMIDFAGSTLKLIAIDGSEKPLTIVLRS